MSARTYTLSLHDALPISPSGLRLTMAKLATAALVVGLRLLVAGRVVARESTGLKASQVAPTYAGLRATAVAVAGMRPVPATWMVRVPPAPSGALWTPPVP